MGISQNNATMHQSMSVISQTTYNSINSEIKFSLNPNENAAHVSTPKKNILKATLKKFSIKSLSLPLFSSIKSGANTIKLSETLRLLS